MAGVKGRSGSGGKRPGSGRPRSLVELRDGDSVVVVLGGRQVLSQVSVSPDGVVSLMDGAILLTEVCRGERNS